MDTQIIKEAPIKYGDLLKEIKNHLKERSGLIMKRALLVSWPILLLVGLFSSADQFGLFDDMLGKIWFGVGIFAIFAVVYALVMTHIFQTEKIIWVLSHGDNRALESSESFRIARRLFWPTVKMRIRIFFRYYLPAMVIFLTVVIASWLMLIYQGSISGYQILVPIITGIVGIIALWFYFYYLGIRLRYIWFLFLDNFGKEEGQDSIWKQMNELNEIRKNETFKKALVSTIGVDITQSVSQSTLNAIFGSLGNMSSEGRVIGDVAATYTSQVTEHMSHLAKQAVYYVLYRISLDAKVGRNHETNENLYLMAK